MTALPSQTHFVYILSSETNERLYTGYTGNLKQRITQHRRGQPRSYTKVYQVFKLVYFEAVENLEVAKKREKQLKATPRLKRLELISKMNPEWKDLFLDL